VVPGSEGRRQRGEDHEYLALDLVDVGVVVDSDCFHIQRFGGSLCLRTDL
jgi:hypothetical protein